MDSRAVFNGPVTFEVCLVMQFFVHPFVSGCSRLSALNDDQKHRAPRRGHHRFHIRQELDVPSHR